MNHNSSQSKLQRNLAGRRYGRRPNADSQCGRILARLKQGALTSDQIRAMGIRDVTTRVWDLRNLWGVAIRTDGNKASGIATYSLSMEPLPARADDDEKPKPTRADNAKWFQEHFGACTNLSTNKQGDEKPLPLFAEVAR